MPSSPPTNAKSNHTGSLLVLGISGISEDGTYGGLNISKSTSRSLMAEVRSICVESSRQFELPISLLCFTVCKTVSHACGLMSVVKNMPFGTICLATNVVTIPEPVPISVTKGTTVLNLLCR